VRPALEAVELTGILPQPAKRTTEPRLEPSAKRRIADGGMERDPIREGTAFLRREIGQLEGARGRAPVERVGPEAADFTRTCDTAPRFRAAN
jgi:hypothetical protein